CPCDGSFKPVPPEWLEHIIDGAEFKSRDGVLIVRRGEDDFRLIVELLENLETSRSGHHHVEKNQFRALLVCERNRSFSVSRLVDLTGPTKTSEVLTECPASQGLIVSDQDGTFHERSPLRCRSACVTALEEGTEKLASNPSGLL